MGLDDCFTIRQDMAILMVLQCCILRCVREGVEWRRSHMLRGKMVMLLMIDHVRRGEMAERRRVLMETRRHHGCDWWESRIRCRLHHKSFRRKQILRLNGDGRSNATVKRA
jgi:hypothetical protein